jgi:hypothetical protein
MPTGAWRVTFHKTGNYLGACDGKYALNKSRAAKRVSISTWDLSILADMWARIFALPC